MHDHPTPGGNPRSELDKLERAALGLLLDHHPASYTLDELARELDMTEVVAEDTVAALLAAASRTDGRCSSPRVRRCASKSSTGDPAATGRADERRPMCNTDGGEGAFPCDTLVHALPHLRRPPMPAAVRFKLQTTADDAGQVVAYVDARSVYDRLDLVCGEYWAACFGPLPRALLPRPALDDPGPPPLYVRCRLTVFGVTPEDVGEGADPKAAVSDAAKRAAVHFGVGRVLYTMRAPWLRAGDADGELRRDARGRLFIDDRTEAWCREKYERWLEDRGQAEFGEPLRHGGPPGQSSGTGGGEEGAEGRDAGENGQPPKLRTAA